MMSRSVIRTRTSVDQYPLIDCSEYRRQPSPSIIPATQAHSDSVATPEPRLHPGSVIIIKSIAVRINSVGSVSGLSHIIEDPL